MEYSLFFIVRNLSANTEEVRLSTFDVLPFKDLSAGSIEHNFQYAQLWIQHQRQELAIYAIHYFIESGKVETQYATLQIQFEAQKVLGVVTGDFNIPLRAAVNMDGMRACLFETQKQHEKVLAAKGNIQFAWLCNQDKRLIQLNDDLIEITQHWQDLIKEIQTFIDPEFSIQKEAEKKSNIKEALGDEVTAPIPQMLAKMQKEHDGYKEV